MMNIFGEILKAIRRIASACFVQGVALPLAFLLILFLASRVLDLTATEVALAYSASALVALFAGYAFWSYFAHPFEGTRRNASSTELLVQAIPMLWISAMNLTMSWTDTILLGFFSDSRSVGIYNACSRTAALISFILVTVNTIAAPTFAALSAKNDIQSLSLVARRTTLYMTLFAGVPTLAIVAFPGLFLSFFGSEFVDGRAVLVILALGHFVNVATGAAGYLLMMSGHEKQMRNITIASAVLNVALNLLLIPRFGILGASIATATSLVLMKIFAAFQVYKSLSIVTVPTLPSLAPRKK